MNVGFSQNLNRLRHKLHYLAKDMKTKFWNMYNNTETPLTLYLCIQFNVIMSLEN
jgi:hypothetical protein